MNGRETRSTSRDEDTVPLVSILPNSSLRFTDLPFMKQGLRTTYRRISNTNSSNNNPNNNYNNISRMVTVIETRRGIIVVYTRGSKHSHRGSYVNDCLVVMRCFTTVLRPWDLDRSAYRRIPSDSTTVDLTIKKIRKHLSQVPTKINRAINEQLLFTAWLSRYVYIYCYYYSIKTNLWHLIFTYVFAYVRSVQLLTQTTIDNSYSLIRIAYIIIRVYNIILHNIILYYTSLHFVTYSVVL